MLADGQEVMPRGLKPTATFGCRSATAADRATPVDSRSMSDSSREVLRLVAPLAPVPKAQDRRSINYPVHHAERVGRPTRAGVSIVELLRVRPELQPPVSNLPLMRRHAFGLIALMFLITAVFQGYQVGWSAMQESMPLSICLRVGLVLGAIWLAYPQLQQIGRRTPPWLVAATGVGILVLLIQPKAFRLLLPAVLLLAALQFVGRLFKTAGPRSSASNRDVPRSRKA